MALIAVKAETSAPLFRTYAQNTARTLHVSVDNGGDAPSGVNYLPFGVIISGASGASMFVDAQGVTTSIAGPAANGVPVFLPLAVASQPGTGAAGVSSTYLWVKRAGLPTQG